DKLWAREINWICGHFRFGLHEVLHLPDVTPHYATFVRDPVMRETSFYYYRKNRNSAQTGPAEDVDHAPTLEEWLRSPLRQRNVQTWFLSGYGRPAETNVALDNLLNKYFFFGITEYMHESVDRMCEAFGFENKIYPNVNSSTRPEIDERQ